MLHLISLKFCHLQHGLLLYMLFQSSLSLWHLFGQASIYLHLLCQQSTQPCLRCHLSSPQPAITYVGLYRVFQSQAPLRHEDPLSLPPTTGSLTPPRPCDPSTPPWLLAPSSPLWPIIPLAPPDSLVTPAPPWSVVDHPPPQDSTPTWSSRTTSSPRSWEPAATGSSVSPRLRVCLSLHCWHHRRSLNPWFHLPGLQVFK